MPRSLDLMIFVSTTDKPITLAYRSMYGVILTTEAQYSVCTCIDSLYVYTYYVCILFVPSHSDLIESFLDTMHKTG